MAAVDEDFAFSGEEVSDLDGDVSRSVPMLR
jgi:hypothetical protein